MYQCPNDEIGSTCNTQNVVPEMASEFDSLLGHKVILRGRAVVARQAHNLKVVGATPTPATKHR